jgi:hypothetical protein
VRQGLPPRNEVAPTQATPRAPPPLKVALSSVLFMAVLAVLVLGPAGASATTVSPGPGSTTANGCTIGSGFFGSVSPVGNALVGFEYQDPQTGDDCILQQGDLIPGDVLITYLYTPQTPGNGTVPIDVEEFNWGSERVTVPGPNNTTLVYNDPIQVNVQWSNTSITASAGRDQIFDLTVPPAFVSPSSPENLSVSLLGLNLSFLIATPGTALPIPETVGSLVEWLALMSPVAVVVTLGGFAPAEWIVRRMRHISTAKWGWAVLLTVVVVEGAAILFNFNAFLYWLGDVGISGLAVLLLFPLFLLGGCIWLTIRGKRLKARIARGPIAHVTREGVPVLAAVPMRIFNSGRIGQPEEMVEGPRVGGLLGAWYRFLGVRVVWKPDTMSVRPLMVHYDWQGGSLPIEGEYEVWPTNGGKQIDVKVEPPETVWFPWRKSVKARFDPPNDLNNGHAAQAKEPQRNPERWAHRGFFLGLRDGEATAAALGSPDHVGPDQYLRGVAPAASFGKEAARLRKMLLLARNELDARAWEHAMEIVAIENRLEAFPGSPEAMEGMHVLSEKLTDQLFNEDAYMDRLEGRGKIRVDYQPPGAKKTSITTSEIVAAEATNPLPPDLRGSKGEGRSRNAAG